MKLPMIHPIINSENVCLSRYNRADMTNPDIKMVNVNIQTWYSVCVRMYAKTNPLRIPAAPL